MTTPTDPKRPSWRRQARRVWRNEDDTQANIHLRDIAEAADQARIREVIDLVMRIAELALSTGASASETTAMVLRMCDAQGLRVHVDITNHSITISQPGGPTRDPVTSLRTVKSRSTDYQRLSRLEGLVHKIATGKVDIATARSRFNDIIVAPRTYRRWVVVTAAATQGAAIAALLGGGWAEIALSILSAGLVDVVLRLLGRAHVPQFFANMVGAAIPALIAALCMIRWPAAVPPSATIIVGAGIVSMLAGLNLVSAARDALDGYYVTSMARIYEAIVLTSAIVVGVTLVLWLGLQAGLPMALSTATRGGVPLALQLVCAGVVATTFSVGCHAGPRAVGIATVLGVATQLTSFAAGLWITGWWPARTGVAAFVTAAVATWGAPRWKVPTVALVSAGIISQVPGSMIYRGLYAALQHETNQAAGQDAGTLLATALLVGAAMAVGANLGTLAARPLALPSDAGARTALFKSWRRTSTADR